MLELPDILLEEYSEWSWEPVSIYPGRSAMHRLSHASGETVYLKVVRHGWTPSAEAEADRTEWACAFLPVPRVLWRGVTRTSSWLLTEGIDGLDATHPTFRDDVPRLVMHLANGLRHLHTVDVHACPFQFGIREALDLVRRRLESGRIDAARDFHPEFQDLTAEAAVEVLTSMVPDSEYPVVCHGDYCVPNVLLRDYRIVGFVDLGELGVADRWWDLAVATWSLTWNFGPGYEDLFLQTYGIARDERRMRFYRLLYDLVS